MKWACGKGKGGRGRGENSVGLWWFLAMAVLLVSPAVREKEKTRVMFRELL